MTVSARSMANVTEANGLGIRCRLFRMGAFSFFSPAAPLSTVTRRMVDLLLVG